MLKQMKKGQTAVEYVVLVVIILGALLAIQNYMKRGFQGRWRDAVDDLGDQYDPATAVTNIRHALDSTTNTSIIAVRLPGGYSTIRTDASSSMETKVGDTAVGAY